MRQEYKFMLCKKLNHHILAIIKQVNLIVSALVSTVFIVID